MQLQSDRCRLRALEPLDVELLYLWENDPALWRVSGTLAPLSRERLMCFIREQSFDIYATRQMRLVVEVEGVAVGTVDICDFDPQNRRFGVGVMIYAAEHRRRGYAREAVEAVMRYGREVLGVRQVWATIAADNTASVALFEECGFERCALKREWIYTPEGYVDQLEYQYLF